MASISWAILHEGSLLSSILIRPKPVAPISLPEIVGIFDV